MRVQAIVDIDNTLWDFAPILYKKLKLLNPSVPPPEKWDRWDFFKDYVSVSDFYRVIEEIHKRQDEYGVYPEAKDFLLGIKKLGYFVVIASHRTKESELPTLKWLKKHELIFDELHLSYDKSILFEISSVVIDDSPFVLEKAKASGLLALGLEHPWNRQNNFLLFKNLMEILSFIEKQRKF
ncbi:MAG: hypothetical protein N2513_03480 [Deltaproteobacteria bacterium]|nr:hypothetical protein [Deltaproteobacteria bacterium]